MLTRAQQKFIRSLTQHKYRKQQGCFLAETDKVVRELLGHFSCPLLCATGEWLAGVGPLAGLCQRVEEVTPQMLRTLSSLITPRDVVAVFALPREQEGWTRSALRPGGPPAVGPSGLVPPVPSPLILALDGVQDPGNLGTILRLADWFGIEHVVCSPGTADPWQPKVVQATMGALARVKVHRVDSLPDWLSHLPSGVMTSGTFLRRSENIYEALRRGDAAGTRVLIMGSEGEGITPAVEALVSRRLFIPSFPPGRPTGESLNVAVATAIAVAALRNAPPLQE